MKNILFIILTVILFANSVFAEDCKSCNTYGTKCIDLMTSMYDKRATLYNVLNLSYDQQKCKDTIDAKFQNELNKIYEQYKQETFVLNNMQQHDASFEALKKQEKVVKNIVKQMQSLNSKYDKELKSILDMEQKSKYNSISKMEKKEIKYCRKQKAFYKRDPKLRPFGEKMYYKDTEKVLCPVHNKWHPFGYKHKSKAE